jgi:hypothetical protein
VLDIIQFLQLTGGDTSPCIFLRLAPMRKAAHEGMTWRLCSMNGVRILLAMLLLLCPPTLPAQASLPDAPDANPARPTVSTPATLTLLGYFQFENGVLYATDS